jgi:hypothetical protein
MTINQRLEKLVQRFSDGIVSNFAKRIGVSHTSIASMMPGSRESKPGFEIIAKVVETFPEVNSDWLLKGEGEMLNNIATGHTSYSNNQTSGGTNMQGTGNSMSLGNDLAKQLEECRQEVNKWRNKYIELLEKQVGG